LNQNQKEGDHKRRLDAKRRMAAAGQPDLCRSQWDWRGHQPFIAAASLDLPSRICVVAFSLAIPLLAVLVMLTQVQSLHHYASYPGYLVAAKTVGQVSTFVGVVAAFWHLLWLAGVLVLVSGSVGFATSRHLLQAPGAR
jgi:hypothetical protein